MQVFGLPRHLTRMAQSGSRHLGAKLPNSEAQRRREAVARWRQARRWAHRRSGRAGCVGRPSDALPLAEAG